MEIPLVDNWKDRQGRAHFHVRRHAHERPRDEIRIAGHFLD